MSKSLEQVAGEKGIKDGDTMMVGPATLGLSAEQFHLTVLRWLDGDLDGFLIDGEPHRENQTPNRYYDLVKLIRDE